MGGYYQRGAPDSLGQLTDCEINDQAPRLQWRRFQTSESELPTRVVRADEASYEIRRVDAIPDLENLRMKVRPRQKRLPEHKTAGEAIRQNEQRLRLVLDSALDAVVSTDAKGIITGWNPHAEKMFGWPREMALGRKIVETTIPPARRAVYEAEMREYLAHGAGVPMEKRVETTALHANGHIFPVEISATSAMVEGEIRFTAFIRDITQRREAERRMVGNLAIARILARSPALEGAMPKLLQTIGEMLSFQFAAFWQPGVRPSSVAAMPLSTASSKKSPRSAATDAAATEDDRAPTEDTPMLYCQAVWLERDAKLPEFEEATRKLTFAPGVGLPGRVWNTRAPLWISDVTENDNFPRAPLAETDGLNTGFAFPIMFGATFLGVMEFLSRQIHQPDDALLGTIHGIGQQIGQFIERKRVEAELVLARDQLAEANRVLDQRVHERTAELTAANSALEEEIRARAQAERARLRLAAIVESSVDAIVSRSLDGHVTSWNKAAQRIFGWTAAEIVGQPCSVLVVENHSEEIYDAVQRVIDGEIVEQFETVNAHKDGRAIEVSMTLSPIRDEEEIVCGVSAIIRDISERKELQNEVLRVAEREQRRIAQDLHDGLGQQLAGISCLTNALKKDLAGQSSADAKTAARISTLLDSAVAQTRNLARGLLPITAEPGSLMLALGQLARHLSGVFKVRCHFDCPEPVEVADATVAAHFYRIAQEAATNSIRHGKARDIAIGLSASPECTVLAVTDDGVGIRKMSRRTKGLGLRIMRHRAGVIGGSLVVQKRRGGGTEVICAVEIKNYHTNGQA